MLKVLKSLLGFPVSGVSAEAITEEKGRAALRRMIGSCPICSGNLDGHRSWRLATVLLTNPESPSAVEIRRLIAERNWKEATKYNEWKADADVREYRVLRCKSGELVLLSIIYKYEMWSDDFVEKADRLDAQAAEQLVKLIDDRWEPT